MSKANQLKPYAIAESLCIKLMEFDDPDDEFCDFSSVEVSGDPEFDDLGVPRYDLTTSDWKGNTLSFRIRVELDPDQLEIVLPPGSDPLTETVLLVTMSCKRTNFRHGIRLTMTDPGVWVGEGSFQRVDVVGTILLNPRLVRTTHHPGAEGVGQSRGAVIARGSPTVVFVDEPMQRWQGAIPTTWEDFRVSDNQWRRENDSDVFNLEPYDDPKLYLNSRYTQLQALLETKGNRGADAALRDLAAAAIAQSVWVQMLVVAISSIEYDSERDSATPPGSGWKRKLLDAALPVMFPGVSEEQHFVTIARQCESQGGLEGVMPRVSTAVQYLVKTYQVVEMALRERDTALVTSEYES